MICVELCYLYLVLSSGARKGTLVTFSPSNCPVLLYWPAATPSVTIIQHWAPKLAASSRCSSPAYFTGRKKFQNISNIVLLDLCQRCGRREELRLKGQRARVLGGWRRELLHLLRHMATECGVASLGRQILLTSELENRTTFCQAISVG